MEINVLLIVWLLQVQYIVSHTGTENTHHRETTFDNSLCLFIFRKMWISRFSVSFPSFFYFLLSSFSFLSYFFLSLFLFPFSFPFSFFPFFPFSFSFFFLIIVF